MIVVPGRISAPGPGSPVVVLTVFDVVAGSQKVETTVPLPVFGYTPSPHGGETGLATPVRSIFAAEPGEVPVGNQGFVASVEQQTWLRPPLESRHDPSGALVWQASPEQVALHTPPPHWSSCTGMPMEGSPA